VRAYFIHFEQVNVLFLFAHMKIPNTIQLSSQTYSKLSDQIKTKKTYNGQANRPWRLEMFFVDD